MFKKNDKDIGFPKPIREALYEYDHRKSIRRSLLGDQAGVKALRQLPIERRRDISAIMECFEGQQINRDKASYVVYQACCDLITNKPASSNERKIKRIK